MFERVAEPLPGAPRVFRWHRAVAIGLSVLFVLYAVWAYWLAYNHPRPVDFLSFWAAGRMALQGHAAAAYDMIAHRLMERTGAPIQGWLPFPYPPAFLIFVAPFGAAPLWVAFALWLAVTSGVYIAGTRKVAPLPYSLAHPAVLVNTWIGQTGFLTCGLFAWGLTVIERRGFLGGVILGLLVIKPQLGLLIPVALLAGREWKALAGGATSALLLLAVAYLLFGADTYRAFFHILPQQASLIAAGKVSWNELASLFASCRLMGIPELYALALQVLAALGGAAVTWRAWARRLNTRAPTLAAASLLVPPYLFTYDSLLLIIPIAWFIRQQKYPLALAVIWLLCLLPIISYSGVYKGPNTIPLAAIMCLWLLLRSEAPPAEGAAEI